MSVTDPCIGNDATEGHAESVYINKSLPNTPVSSERISNGEAGKSPSYLGLSCAVSGYSDLMKYDSRRRQELKSRDNSPARWYIQPNEESRPRGRKASTGAHARSMSVDRYQIYNGRKIVTSKSPRVQEKEKSSSLHKSSECLLSDMQRSRINGVDDREYQDIVSDGKSFIQEQIHKLYGNNMSIQTFKRPSRPTTQSSTTPPHTKNTPPVFRFLRREFQEKLSLSESPRRSEPKKEIVSPKSSKSVTPRGRSELVHQKSVEYISLKSEKTTHKGLFSPTNSESSFAERLEATSPKNLEPAEKCVPVSPENSESSAREKTSPKDSGLIAPQLVSEGAPSKKDGAYFLQILDSQVLRIQSEIKKLEEDLECGDIPEDMAGTLRSAIGKGRLLLNQKFKQFQGLCEQNLTPSSDETVKDEDLEGFWDMVCIQVDNVNDMFSLIGQWRETGWKEKVKKPQQISAQKSPKKVRKTAAKLTESQKERNEERRRQLQEAKRRLAASNTNNKEDVLLFFVT